jgi:hypothetical protein
VSKTYSKYIAPTAYNITKAQTFWVTNKLYLFSEAICGSGPGGSGMSYTRLQQCTQGCLYLIFGVSKIAKPIVPDFVPMLKRIYKEPINHVCIYDV